MNWQALSYAGMFMLAYGVFVAVGTPTTKQPTATAAASSSVTATHQANNAEIVLASVATVALSSSSASSAPLTMERQQAVRELSQVAMQSEDVDERMAALRQLNETHTEDALQALARVLQTDDAPRNRLQAVSSLRQLGLQADHDGRIRALLRSAQQDNDANVASSALDAAQQLERKYGS